MSGPLSGFDLDFGEDRTGAYTSREQERIADLERQLAEAKEDTARLNWWESQKFNGATEIYLGGPWTYQPETNQTIGRWKIEGQLGKRYETLREAVDAARKERG